MLFHGGNENDDDDDDENDNDNDDDFLDGSWLFCNIFVVK